MEQTTALGTVAGLQQRRQEWQKLEKKMAVVVAVAGRLLQPPATRTRKEMLNVWGWGGGGEVVAILQLGFRSQITTTPPPPPS